MIRHAPSFKILFKKGGIHQFRLPVSPSVISDCFIFISFFLAVWLWVHPAINFCYPGFWRYTPVGGYTPWFLTDAPLGPGKFSFWLTSLVAPCLAGPITGSIVITVITYILSLLTGQVLAMFGVRKLLDLKYIPAMLVFFQYGYLLNPISKSISVIIGLIALRLIHITGGSHSRNRFLLYLAFASIVIAVAVEAFLIFGLLVIFFECFVRRKYILAVVEAVVLACLPAVITVLFFPFTAMSDTYSRIFPNFPGNLSIIGFLPFLFWIFFPCIGIAAFIEKPIINKSAFLIRKVSGTALGAFSSGYWRITPSVLMVIITIGIVRFNHEPFTLARPNAVMNYAMLSHKWNLLLDEAGKIPEHYLSDSKIHLIDRALYHKGRLLEDLFMFPQNQNALLLFPYSGSAASLGPADRFWAPVWSGWTYFELGLINTAEHCGLEALSQFYYPQGLQLLAMIYAVKDMPEASHTCLKALRKDRVYHTWAETYLYAMENDQTPSRTPEINTIRSIALKEGFVLSGAPPLAMLVKENPHNKMAFEYLIASWLIGRRIDSVTNRVSGLRELKYQKIPRLYEEALLLDAFLTEKNPDLCGYTLSEDAMQSFEKFCAILYSKHGGRPNDAFDDLSASFGGSYFFYYVYGFSNAKAIHERK